MVKGFSGGPVVKNSLANAVDSVPESERSSGETNGNPLQYFCLENSMNRGYSPWVHKESDTTE